MNSEKQSINLQMTLRGVNRVGEGQKNVPKLRFKGYEDAWEQRKLGELCERVVRKNKNYESDLPLTIASQFGLIDQRNFFGKIVAAKDMSNYYLLKKGEFAYNKSYSKGFDFGSINRLNNYELGCLSTLYICFKIASNRVESDYLEVYFDTLNWYKDVMSICAEGARNHGLLNVDTKAFFEEVNIDIPREVLEQKNIASSLEKVEKLITLHQRKYDALKSMKKTLLSKMFPKNGEDVPEIRFKGFTDAWEQRKLGDVKDVRDGTHDSPKYIPTGYPLVTSKNLTENGLDYSDISYISEYDFLAINKRSKVEIGDIIFGMIGTIGNPVMVKSEGFAIKNVALLKNNGIINNSFLIHLLKSPIFTKYIKLENAGGTQKFLGLSQIRNFECLIPNEGEQVILGDFFLTIDNLITLHQRKLDELKHMKKTLLQQIFV